MSELVPKYKKINYHALEVRGFCHKLMKNKLTLIIAALLVLLAPVVVRAVPGDLSVRIEQSTTPTNDNTFKINMVTLDLLGRSITAKCYKKGPGDSSFVQFGSDILISSGGGESDCVVDGGVMPSAGTYEFYVSVTAGGDTKTSSTVGVEYKTDAPDTPTKYNKEKLSNCEYKILFKTANDAKTAKVEVYRSDKTSFDLNTGSRVGEIYIGPNQEGVFTNTIPTCGQDYYYAIRAFDSAGNGSGVIGDSVTTITTTQASASAIAVGDGSSQVGKVLGDKLPDDESEEEGLATNEPSVKGDNTSGEGDTTVSYKNYALAVIGAVTVLFGLGIYISKRRG